MKVCEIENCTGQKLNSSEILYYDESEKAVRKLSGQKVIDFTYKLDEISAKFIEFENALKELKCDSLNVNVLDELNSIRELISKMTLDISAISSDKFGIQNLIDETNIKLEKAIDDLKISYDNKLASFNDEINKNLDDNILSLKDIVNKFDKHVVDAENKIDQDIEDNSNDLQDEKNKLSKLLDDQIKDIENKIKDVNNTLDTLVDKSDLDKTLATNKENLDKDLEAFKKENDEIKAKFENDSEALRNDFNSYVSKYKDQVDQEIKTQIKDKLVKINGKSLLGGSDISTARNRFVDLYSRGNISSTSAAIAIAKTIYEPSDGDFYVIRWKTRVYVRSGYHGYYRNNNYTKKFIISGGTWVNV